MEMAKNELSEQNRLENLIFEWFSHSDKMLFNDNSQDIDFPLNPRTNFYSYQEFNDLVQSRHSNIDKLWILH